MDTGESHPWVSLLLDLQRDMELISLKSQLPFLKYILPFMLPKNMVENSAKFVKFSNEGVALRISRQNDMTRTDFFKHMLDKGNFPLRTFESNAAVLLLGGSETTSTALSAAMYYLSIFPDFLSQLQTEIRERFTSLDQVTGDATSSLPYLHAILEETLRIFPPVPLGLPRVSPGAVIGEHYVPKGTIVSTNNWTISHDKRYWVDPDTFRPERWLGEGIGDNKKAFHPFLLGPRSCMGINLAYLEMKVILAQMVLVYDFGFLDGFNWPERCKSFLAWERAPFRMKFYARM